MEDTSDISVTIFPKNITESDSYCNDSTLAELPEQDDSHEYFLQIRFVCYSIVMPIILGFGIIGNFLNILVLCQQRLHKGMDKIERCAAMGFIFLAASDLCFCLVGFPSAFLKNKITAIASKPYEVAAFLYSLYRPGLMNIFHFSSTWSIVFVAFERYLVVTHPMVARSRVRLRRTAIFQILIPVISVMISIPQFMHWKIERSDIGNNTVVLSPTPKTHLFSFTYKIIWNILIALLPMLILMYCNLHLLFAIYKTKAHGFLSVDKYSTSRITIILILIVTFYFVLVGPSVIVNFLTEDFLQEQLSKEISYRLYKATVITNVLQSANFAVNFLLYFGMHPKFRQNMRCQQCERSDRFQPLYKKEVIHLRVR